MAEDEAESDALLEEKDAVNKDVESETSPEERRKGWVKSVVKSWWRRGVILLTPLVLVPIPAAVRTQPAYAFYAIAIIAVYWITEAVPLAVTSLLPMVLFPALGVLSAGDTAANYLNDTNMLFVGGLMVAVAIEKWNLHKRIALLVLLAVGSKPKWLLFGFMSVTAFLSMWISNTATAAMMLPISHAVLQEIKAQCLQKPSGEDQTQEAPNKNILLVSARYKRNYDGTQNEKDDQVMLDIEPNKQREGAVAETQEGDTTMGPNTDDHRLSDRSPSPDYNNRGFTRLTKGLTLGIAYSANIGGTGTLTGTGPNLVLSGDMSKLFPKSPGVNFGTWFVFATPAMILSLFLSWVYLSLIFCDDSFHWLKVRFFKVNSHLFSSKGARKVLKKEYEKLGSWSFAEIQLLVYFIVLALLWLFREPRFVPGWGEIFRRNDETNKSYFSDSSTVMFTVFLLFVTPANACFSLKGQKKFSFDFSNGKESLLDWDSVQHKLPWNVVLLLGSGFAIAEAAEASGLSCWIGSKLLVIEPLPNAVKALTVSVLVASITEVISNVATTTLFLPILAQLLYCFFGALYNPRNIALDSSARDVYFEKITVLSAVNLSINPLYLMIPATVSASYAFMLPVATPPNAIAFSFGYLKVYDMVLTGILMNIVCIFVVNLAVNTWAIPLFDLKTFPNWTETSVSSNCTALY